MIEATCRAKGGAATCREKGGRGHRGSRIAAPLSATKGPRSSNLELLALEMALTGQWGKDASMLPMTSQSQHQHIYCRPNP